MVGPTINTWQIANKYINHEYQILSMGKKLTIREEIVSLLHGGEKSTRELSTRELSEELEKPYANFSKTLKELEKEDLIKSKRQRKIKRSGPRGRYWSIADSARARAYALSVHLHASSTGIEKTNVHMDLPTWLDIMEKPERNEKLLEECKDRNKVLKKEIVEMKKRLNRCKEK